MSAFREFALVRPNAYVKLNEQLICRYVFTSLISDPHSPVLVVHRQAAYQICENTTGSFNIISDSHRPVERPSRLTRSFDLRIDVNNIKPPSVSMEVLEWAALCYCRATECFVLLSRVSSSGKVPDIFCPILTKSGSSQQIFVEVPAIQFYENPSSGSCADNFG